MKVRTHATVMLSSLTLAAGLAAATMPAEAASNCDTTRTTGKVRSFNSNKTGGVIEFGNPPPAGTPGSKLRPAVSFNTKEIKPPGTTLKVGDQVTFIKCVFPSAGGSIGMPAGATKIQKVVAPLSL